MMFELMRFGFGSRVKSIFFFFFLMKFVLFHFISLNVVSRFIILYNDHFYRNCCIKSYIYYTIVIISIKKKIIKIKFQGDLLNIIKSSNKKKGRITIFISTNSA